MRKYLLPEKGNFYKANLHCHSNWSDGAHSPEDLKKLYKSHGYSVLSITDHNGLFSHYDLDDEDFITLTGYEVNFDERRGSDYCEWLTTHICAIAKDKENFRQPGYNPNYFHPRFGWCQNPDIKALARPEGEPFSMELSAENVNYVMKTLRENGFIVTHNHPVWSIETYPMYMAYCGMDNLEIYNHGCYVAGYDEHSGKIYDEQLRAGKRIRCIACDDNHASIGRKNHDMFGGFTMFRAEKLTYECIIDAFEKGNFYASTGPTISALYVEDGKICVEAEKPVEAIRFVTGLRRAGYVFDPDGKPVSSASFDIHPDCKYVRIELLDGLKRAYTCAYFVDELLN